MDKQLDSIDRALGRLDGRLGEVTKAITEMKADQKLILNEVKGHGERLGILEGESTRRGQDCSARFNKQSNELDRLRNCSSRVNVALAVGKIKWQLLLKIVMLVAGGGTVGALLQYLIR